MVNDKFGKMMVTTLPGWRPHYDIFFYAGWRIQKNELKNTYRVVSPTGRKWKCASESECHDILNQKKTQGLSPRNSHLVIIVPGLNNLRSTFSEIEKGLIDCGYETMLWDFASNRANTMEHAARLSALIDGLENIKKISFIAHSMGGLIIRAMLSGHHAWYDRFELGHIVNIASPHGGSFVADLVSAQPLFKGLFDWVCGRAGYDLTTEGARELPPVRVPIGVIIGGAGNTLGLNPLAGQDNDIVVSRDSAKIELAADFIQIKGSHTLMLWDKKTVQQSIYFIQNGCFLHDIDPKEKQ